MKLKTKKTICLLIGIASILAIVSTVSYAYFTASGEVKKLEAIISTGTASARFADNDTGITGELKFGESITKKFTIQNTGTAEARVKMYWKDLVNTYTPETLTYTLSQSETLEGPYIEVVSKMSVPRFNSTLVDSLTIPVGETYYYNLVITLNYLEDVNQDADLSAMFSSTFRLEDSYSPITAKDILGKFGKISQGEKNNFDAPATTDEGIFEMEDDYGTSYYYRGAVENNYVKFGKNKSGQDMYWRIIRINGDASLRIIYDGTQGYSNGTSNNDRFIKVGIPFNTSYRDAKYVGWMYGPIGTTGSKNKEEAQANIESSNVKKVVDTWYKDNIVDTGYGNNVSDAVFCNDRSVPGKILSGWSSDTGLGYGVNTTAYGAYARMKAGFSGYANPDPTFKCPQQNDAFTVGEKAKGNGKLDYPVGLITADEILCAGSGKYGTSNSNYYLYKGEYNLWSLSPYDVDPNGSARMFGINAKGNLTRNGVDRTEYAVAPVINLSAKYVNTMIGTGTITDPYRAG